MVSNVLKFYVGNMITEQCYGSDWMPSFIAMYLPPEINYSQQAHQAETTKLVEYFQKPLIILPGRFVSFLFLRLY